MLFEIVFQFEVANKGEQNCCDLMLFEIVFQSNFLMHSEPIVVI